jgi:hypothetical protein
MRNSIDLLTVTLSLGLFASVVAAQSSSYCAFEVIVRTPSGGPVANVPVQLVSHKSTVLSHTTTDEQGRAKICNAPMERVDIAVGLDLCGSVVVRMLQPRWPDTRRVFVTYVREVCSFVPVHNDCLIVLRIQDDRGQPVQGARLETKSITGPGTNISDEFGRIFLSTPKGGWFKGLVRKDDRRPEDVSLRCEEDLELKVTLPAAH